MKLFATVHEAIEFASTLGITSSRIAEEIGMSKQNFTNKLKNHSGSSFTSVHEDEINNFLNARFTAVHERLSLLFASVHEEKLIEYMKKMYDRKRTEFTPVHEASVLVSTEECTPVHEASVLVSTEALTTVNQPSVLVSTEECTPVHEASVLVSKKKKSPAERLGLTQEQYEEHKKKKANERSEETRQRRLKWEMWLEDERTMTPQQWLEKCLSGPSPRRNKSVNKASVQPSNEECTPVHEPKKPVPITNTKSPAASLGLTEEEYQAQLQKEYDAMKAAGGDINLKDLDDDLAY